MKHKFVIGSRGSELALWQTHHVRETLEKRFPEITLEIKIIKTTGDKLLDVALSKIGDKGLFTRQIETALLNGEIDMAVHSLKDLQTAQPEGLMIGAVSKRETPNDVLISKSAVSICRVNNPLSPIFDSATSSSLSPVVLIILISRVISGKRFSSVSLT